MHVLERHFCKKDPRKIGRTANSFGPSPLAPARVVLHAARLRPPCSSPHRPPTAALLLAAPPSCFIEAGHVPFPHYGDGGSPSSGFTLDWDDGDAATDLAFKRSCYMVGGKRERAPDQELKKGVPWTEEEHKLFLMGLKKYGRGDWRNISCNFVDAAAAAAGAAEEAVVSESVAGVDLSGASDEADAMKE